MLSVKVLSTAVKLYKKVVQSNRSFGMVAIHARLTQVQQIEVMELK